MGWKENKQTKTEIETKGPSISTDVAAQEDSFEVESYYRSLAEFIVECDTPMTIAIQGDWGSGKSSMMNFVQNVLINGQASKKEAVCISFNT